MRIFIASDHAGFLLKEEIKLFFQGLALIDFGCDDLSSVDYPDYAHKLCRALTETDDKGILICGSGVGMSIVANRYSHVRAALCFNKEMAELARKHNDANILVLGARNITKEEAFESIKKFLYVEFEQGKHLIRVKKI